MATSAAPAAGAAAAGGVRVIGRPSATEPQWARPL